MGLLHEALPASTLVVAVDPGKVSNWVWLSTGEAGTVVPPLSLPVLRPGLDQLHRLVVEHTGPSDPVFAIEATGGLHQAWVRELSQRFPRSVRLFAPSETAAARAQLGSRRFKTDDRDCAALTTWPTRARAGPFPTRFRTRWPLRCVTGAVWSLNTRLLSSGCTTSCTRSVPAWLLRRDMAGRCRSTA